MKGKRKSITTNKASTRGSHIVVLEYRSDSCALPVRRTIQADKGTKRLTDWQFIFTQPKVNYSHWLIQWTMHCTVWNTSLLLLTYCSTKLNCVDKDYSRLKKYQHEDSASKRFNQNKNVQALKVKWGGCDWYSPSTMQLHAPLTTFKKTETSPTRWKKKVLKFN